MKIRELIQVWNALDGIYANNDIFPPFFEAAQANNFRILAPVIKKIQGKEKELADKDIDLPLTKLSIEDLPDRVPAGTVSALAPILKDWEPVDFDPETININNDESKTEEPETEA